MVGFRIDEVQINGFEINTFEIFYELKYFVLLKLPKIESINGHKKYLG